VRRFLWTIFGFWLCGLLAAAGADTYSLTDGTSMTGDVISYNDNGIVFRLSVDQYSQRIPWTKFSQDALKLLANNPKLKPLVEPFIETPPPSRMKKQEVTVHEVSRLELPPKQSLFAALFASSVGLVVLLLIYVANIFAAYEIAAGRAQPIALVMGVAVVLPVLGPIIFLAMPRRVEPAHPAASQPAAVPHTFAVGSAAAPAAAGIHIVDASWHASSSSSTSAAAAPSEAQTFQRGQFTFNRRFFETKFSGYFALIRREAEKNMELTVKTGRAHHVVERITRISTNEMHIEIGQGAVKQEIMVPFAEIVEIQLKPKDA
jgi:hypothetical protein